MKIHKEGINTITVTFTGLLILNLFVYVLCECLYITAISLVISAFILFVIIYFFRKPVIKVIPDNNLILSPADGKVVVIEKTKENEYFKDERIQISVFMSVWNVHINRFPVSGIIKYFKYHEGKYLLARNPKSSEENERTSVVIKTENGTEILYRQIAGIVARRIVFYVREGKKVQQGKESGFIKFGSRVDVFLPVDADINVKLGDKVKGGKTILAEISGREK